MGFLSKFFQRSRAPNCLGRWQVVTNAKDGDKARRDALTRAAMANMDSCGDGLCGDPTHFKKLVRADNELRDISE